jgi:cytochrome c
MKASAIKLGLFFVTMALIAIPARTSAFDKSSVCVELTEKAEALVLQKGKDYALKVFSASKGPFIDGELYVFACSMDNKLLAHPYRRELVGEDVKDFKDSKGRPLFQEFQKVAEERGAGWVYYWWSKPGEQGEFPKVAYIKRIPDYNMYVGVGYYKPLQMSQDLK